MLIVDMITMFVSSGVLDFPSSHSIFCVSAACCSDHAAPADDDFGLSSAPQDAGETSDPFATVDGGSSSNAGSFDSFSNQPPEVKEEEAAALKSVLRHVHARPMPAYDF